MKNPPLPSETSVAKYNQMCSQVMDTFLNDYAGCQTNPHRGNMSVHKALIASTFDRSKWEELFIRAIYRYLSEFKDRQLRLLIRDGNFYQNTSRGFRTRHFQDSLYITESTADQTFSTGDRIVALDGRPVLEKYEMVKDWLYNSTPEREVWTGIFKSVSQVTVEHGDGRQQEVSLQVYPASCDLYENAFQWLDPETAYLKLQNEIHEGEIHRIFEEQKESLAISKKLIIDLRRNIGGSEQAYAPLLPFLVKQPTSLAELKGSAGDYTCYTENNCKYRVQYLDNFLDSRLEEETAPVIEMIKFYKQRNGAGFQFESQNLPDDEDTIIEPANPEQKVVLLSDTYCENAGETLVEMCSRLSEVTIIGRPTMGCTDYSNLVLMPLNHRFTLVYPMSRSEKVDQGCGLNGKGVPVDEYIPWSPEECEHDVILQRALEI